MVSVEMVVIGGGKSSNLYSEFFFAFSWKKNLTFLFAFQFSFSFRV